MTEETPKTEHQWNVKLRNLHRLFYACGVAISDCGCTDAERDIGHLCTCHVPLLKDALAAFNPPKAERPPFYELIRLKRRGTIVRCNVQTYHENDWTETPLLHKVAQTRATAVTITTSLGYVYIGISLCSKPDQFLKAKGRGEALKLAIQALTAKTPCFQNMNTYPEDKRTYRLVELMREMIAKKRESLKGPDYA